jgi:hypothetical protein
MVECEKGCHHIWPGQNGAVLVKVTVCDADLVKIRVCSLRSGNTSKKKCLKHLFHLNIVIKPICLI